MRIRSIKPEFWRSDDITELTIEDRLLFIGLWSYVDDNGVGLDTLHKITADLFAGDVFGDPRETFARVSRGLQNLSEAGRIVRYTVQNRDYLSIVNWAKHQRIDKPNKPRYPDPTCTNTVIRESVASMSRDSRDSVAPGTEEQGNRGTGDLKTRPPKSADGYPDDFLEFWSAYPRKDGKRKALGKYRAALKRSNHADILAGVVRYNDDPNRKSAYTAMATTWLERDGWQDGPIPADNVTSIKPMWTPPPGSNLSYVEM